MKDHTAVAVQAAEDHNRTVRESIRSSGTPRTGPLTFKRVYGGLRTGFRRYLPGAYASDATSFSEALRLLAEAEREVARLHNHMEVMAGQLD